MKIRILSYNIHKGFSSSRAYVLDGIKRAIDVIQADLVFLQEVSGEHDRAPGRAQFEALADRVWHHHAYGRNAVTSSGHHGNAILSKLPILAWENLNVSTNRFEKRGILHAVVDLDPPHRRPLHAICLHFDLFARGRLKQAELLCARVEKHVPAGEPLVIAGDFNDWGEHVSEILQERLGVQEAFTAVRGAHARSFPAWLPLLRLDRIYVRGLAPRSAEVLTGAQWRGLSDHAALFCEVEA